MDPRPGYLRHPRCRHIGVGLRHGRRRQPRRSWQHTRLATILTRWGLRRSARTPRSSVYEVLNLGLNTSEGATMKIFHPAFAALLITGSMFVQPAHAQSTPQEYRTSCTDARVEDRTVCRFADGRERTSLTDVNRCVGDIGNDNGA